MRNRTIQAVLLVLLVVSMIQPMASGQTETVVWENVNPSTAPSARWAAGMAYDSGSDVFVLFSGRDPQIPYEFGDTWTYDVDSNIWTNVTPEDSPPPRGTHGFFEYDSQSERAVFFGGVLTLNPFRCYGDTWAYSCNTNTWENKTPALSPRAGWGHGWAYDSESDRFILYGGMWDDRVPSSETWSYHYDTNTWTNMSPSTNPDLLSAFGMTYDSESDRVILFGGYFRNATFEEQRDQTWAYDFDSNTWTNMNPPVAPPARNSFQMTYHAAWDRVVLFGGDRDDPSIYYSDTWLYDYNTNNWTELIFDTHPSSRVYADLVYDSDSEKIVLFGGSPNRADAYGDTWVLSNLTITPTTPTTPTTTTGDGGLPTIIIVAIAGTAVVILVLVVFVRRR